MNTLGFVETFWQDLRFGLRVLWKSPSLTAVALLSLSLGIGATTAIFSVVYGVLISPYPYARTGRDLGAGDPQRQESEPRDAETYRPGYSNQQLPAFADGDGDLARRAACLNGDLAPENFTPCQLTGERLSVSGGRPVLGRTILPSDINANGKPEPVSSSATGLAASLPGQPRCPARR